MAWKLFVTGSTGYIGGDALYAIVDAHPEYEVTCLVRNADKGAQVASQYPRVKLVYGDLDSTDLLEREAKVADVVLHCAHADHYASAVALTTGLSAHSSESPGFLIHTSGTGILMFGDVERKSYGEASTKIFDDWDNINEVTSIPDFASHRDVDKVVLGAGKEHEKTIKTAIVCPPTIYGTGRGPGNQRSHQVYEMARCTLERKEGFQVGAGETHWTNVHVHDLSDCYLKLVEEAAQGGGKATWGMEGYYFTEHADHVWGDVSHLVAAAAHKQGLIPSDKVVSIGKEEADKLTRAGSLLWGANSRCKAIRAKKLLGWTPKSRSLQDEIPDIVAGEAKKLGLIQGHAVKAAG
ncbi:MAG: hypothetical protein M1827_004474 [Pycnora praestabilis]|nr:MAG: hypothetical protein M1827_004474 [Pycnora praestabilis]